MTTGTRVLLCRWWKSFLGMLKLQDSPAAFMPNGQFFRTLWVAGEFDFETDWLHLLAAVEGGDAGLGSGWEPDVRQHESMSYAPTVARPGPCLGVHAAGRPTPCGVPQSVPPLRSCMEAP